MQEFREELAGHSLTPLWDVLHDLVPAAPASPATPFAWRYDTVRAFLMRAGELITAEAAERRVLILENPGLAGASAITRALYAGLQLVLPGEIAPCHRHAQSALRFVLEGNGAHTAVNGEKVLMRPFDLVLTPSGLWHDHGNETDEPIIWLDGLDIPLLQTLDCGYAERYYDRAFPETRPPGDARFRYGANTRPVAPRPHDDTLGDQPLFHYPYAEWRRTLAAMAAADDPDAHDGYKCEFINPVHGGPAMRTMSCFSQLVPRGLRTAPRRATDGAVFTVCEGRGKASIGGETFDVAPRDVFVAPSWSEVRFTPQEDLVLFSFSDRAVQEKLGLWRELRA